MVCSDEIKQFAGPEEMLTYRSKKSIVGLEIRDRPGHLREQLIWLKLAKSGVFASVLYFIWHKLSLIAVFKGKTLPYGRILVFPAISFFKLLRRVSQASWCLVCNFQADYNENPAWVFPVLVQRTSPGCTFQQVMQCCPESSKGCVVVVVSRLYWNKAIF